MFSHLLQYSCSLFTHSLCREVCEAFPARDLIPHQKPRMLLVCESHYFSELKYAFVAVLSRPLTATDEPCPGDSTGVMIYVANDLDYETITGYKLILQVVVSSVWRVSKDFVVVLAHD